MCLQHSRRSRKNFLLLELLICFALITLCLFPLLRPHFQALHHEQELIRDLEKSDRARQEFGQRVERLYAQRVRLEDLPEDMEVVRKKESEALSCYLLQYNGHDRTKYILFIQKNA